MRNIGDPFGEAGSCLTIARLKFGCREFRFAASALKPLGSVKRERCLMLIRSLIFVRSLSLKLREKRLKGEDFSVNTERSFSPSASLIWHFVPSSPFAEGGRSFDRPLTD